MIQIENFKQFNNGRSQVPLFINFPTDHILIMPENITWHDTPRGMPAGYHQTILEGNPKMPEQFTFRAKIPANWQAMPHFHPTDEYITVIEGICYIGLGKLYDESTAIRMPTGAFSIMRKDTIHYFFTEETCIIQVHGTGPQKISYVYPDNDPRNNK